MSIAITFLGAARTVTGSAYLVDSDQSQVMVDVGMFQGRKEIRQRNWADPDFPAPLVEAVILTHTHLDHIGRIPRLVANGSKGPIFCTPPTIELAEILLKDAAHLQMEDAEYLNRKAQTSHRPALPLFDDKVVERAMKMFVPMEGASVASALNAFMLRSEQLESHFVLAANSRDSVGLLVQKIPPQGGRESADTDPDLWNRIHAPAATLTREELLEQEETAVLHRLFHQEEVRLWPARAVAFRCRCSKERVASVLKLLGADEIRGLLTGRRSVDVDCDFCGQRYTLTANEAWAALAG